VLFRSLVDGVGYPSVGSICNLSNANVASTLNSSVLLVGKAGVGDAVDSYNLNSIFFESQDITVLGGVFNKFPLTGYYNLTSCKESIELYFSQYRSNHRLYGFIPTVENAGMAIDDDNGTEWSFEDSFMKDFMARFDMNALILDLWNYKLWKQTVEFDSSSVSINTQEQRTCTGRQQAQNNGREELFTSLKLNNQSQNISIQSRLQNENQKHSIPSSSSNSLTSNNLGLTHVLNKNNNGEHNPGRKRTRENIEAHAIQRGASKGGG